MIAIIGVGCAPPEVAEQPEQVGRPDEPEPQQQEMGEDHREMMMYMGHNEDMADYHGAMKQYCQQMMEMKGFHIG